MNQIYFPSTEQLVKNSKRNAELVINGIILIIMMADYLHKTYKIVKR
jgi:hypothetical protein